MICDMSDVTMDGDFEEEKHSTNLAPTPSAAHNPNPNKTCNGGGFKATKMSKASKMSELSKKKDASDIQKMSEMAKNVKSASNNNDLTNLTESLTSSKEKVAVAEISPKCDVMSNFSKVMGHTDAAVSAHSVSEMRQINMAGNI